MAHFTNTREFLDSAQIGDTLHEERPNDRRVTDSVAISVTEDDDQRFILTRELSTTHDQDRKTLVTILSVGNYATEKDSVFVTSRIDYNAPRMAVDRTPIARYSKKALASQHSAYKGMELDPDAFEGN